MYIEKIKITKFKHLERVDLPPFRSGMQVIYGENEAGKSTLQAFIHAMLFGPVSGDTVSGTLSFHAAGQSVLIERRDREVRIFDEDGAHEGDQRLKQWLGGLNRKICQAIFSFDLDGLSAIENVRMQALNDHLFQAGMAGQFPVRELEKWLEKKEAERFKPYGRKPRINVLLEQLQNEEEELEAARNEQGRYIHIRQKIKAVHQDLDKIVKQREKLKRQIRKQKLFEKIEPLLERKETLKRRLQLLHPEETFPQDGLLRFDHWKEQKLAVENELQKRQREKNKLEEQWHKFADGGPRGASVLQDRERIIQLQEEERWAVELTRRAEKLRRESELRQEELQQLLDELGAGWNRRRVLEANTGIREKKELEKLVTQGSDLRDEQRQNEKEMARLEETVEKLAEQEKALRNHAAVEYGRHSETGRRFGAAIPKAASLFVISGLLLMILALVKPSDLWMIAAGTCFLFGYFFVRIDGNRKMGDRGAALGDHVQFASVAERKAEAQAEYKIVLQRTETHHAQWRELQEKTEAWCRKNHFLPETRPDVLERLFPLVVECKKTIRRLEALTQELQEIETDLNKRKETVRQLCKRHQVPFSDGRAVQQLVEVLAQAEERRQKRQELKKQQEVVKEQIAELEARRENCAKEIDRLFQMAQALDEESFRKKAGEEEKRRKLREELAVCENQIAVLLQNEAHLEELHQELEKQKTTGEVSAAALEKKYENLENEERECWKRLAGLENEKNRMEKDGTVSEKMHVFQQKKDALRKEARQWAVYRAAKMLLEQAKEKHRRERQPRLLARAGEYFMQITGGKYEKLEADRDGILFVTENSGRRLYPGQMSRGTKEQLYLALRLALCGQFNSATPFPVLCDDALVNFDQQRMEAALNLLRHVSRQRQVILFTCHPHIRDAFREGEWIALKNLTALEQL